MSIGARNVAMAVLPDMLRRDRERWGMSVGEAGRRPHAPTSRSKGGVSADAHALASGRSGLPNLVVRSRSKASLAVWPIWQ